MYETLFLYLISYYFYYLIYFILKLTLSSFIRFSISFHISPIILSNDVALLRDRVSHSFYLVLSLYFQSRNFIRILSLS